MFVVVVKYDCQWSMCLALRLSHHRSLSADSVVTDDGRFNLVGSSFYFALHDKYHYPGLITINNYKQLDLSAGFYRVNKIIELYFQLRQARSIAKYVDEYIAKVRVALSTLQSFGLNLDYLEIIIGHVENGRQRLIDITIDAEAAFVYLKFSTKVRTYRFFNMV